MFVNYDKIEKINIVVRKSLLLKQISTFLV